MLFCHSDIMFSQIMPQENVQVSFMVVERIYKMTIKDIERLGEPNASADDTCCIR